MEQWEAAHLRTNYDIVLSFAKSRGVDLNYGASSPPLPFVLPSGFSFLFFLSKRRLALQAAARDHKPDGRGHVRLRSDAQTSFVRSAAARSRRAPKMRSEQLEFLCTGWYGNSQQISVEFPGGEKEDKKRSPGQGGEEMDLFPQ